MTRLLQRAGSPRRLRDRVGGGADRFLFIGAFAVGAGWIVAAKALSVPQWLVTAVPVGVMLGYAGVVWRAKKFQIREDRAGDNLYYLGFLFTLVSLSVALYQFTDREGGTAAIVSNFGIALATTICGLGLRVFVNQMREDPVEIEREARLELSLAVRALKVELDESVMAFNSFRRELTQSLHEGLETMTEGTIDGLKESLSQFSAATSSMVDRMDATFTDFSSHAKKLNGSANKTVAAADKLLDRLQGIEVPADILDRKLEPVARRLIESADAMIAHARSEADQLDLLRKSIEAAAAATGELDRRVAAMDSHSAAIGELAASASATVGSLRDFQQLMSRMQEAMAGATDRIRDAQEQAASAAIESASRQKALLDGLSGSVETAVTLQRKSLEDIGAAGSQAAALQAETYAKLAAAAAADVQVVSEHRAALSAELEKSREMVGQLHDSLVSLAEAVTRRADVG